ncbi:hypothetical protein P8935_04505 [Telmatobacter sp. DSM 110680]|uniref:Outer membrane lipoprotein-sorting protein n=1 Tax=Telmatobacter sp. DSM 110680 TaxID=3036704 RepID=A0AAU7DNI4_9BACT
MKKIIHGILVVAAMAYAVSMNGQTAPRITAAEPAPTADEIVGKYVDAIGGKDAISKVKSVYTESSIAMMGGDNPSTTTLVDGVGFKNETDFNGTKIVQCFTSKGGWSVNPMAGAASPTPMPEDIYNAGKGQINVGGPLYDYAAKGNKIELFGKDGNAWKIKLTSKENVETVFLIDSTSFLITAVKTKGKMQDQDVDITTKLSDYRKTDVGYMVPYAIDVDLGGQFNLTVTVKKVELNKTIDPAVFEMPKS